MESTHELIQYASDLHLEFLDPQKTKFEQIVFPACPILVLAGDICQPEKFIMSKFMEYVSARWRHVIWIAGNHEYYNHKPKQSWRHNRKVVMTINEKEEYMNSFSKLYSNIHYLQKGFFDIPDTNIRILGCTLWSEYEPDKEVAIANYLNDFNFIAKEGLEPITTSDIQAIHYDHLSWLLNSLKIAHENKKRAVVVSHHLPLYQLIDPKYEGDEYSSAYANKLDYIFEMPSLHAWICGHSHSTITYKYEREDKKLVPCVLNCRGYPKEYIPLYSAYKVLDIPPHRKKKTSEIRLCCQEPLPKSPLGKSSPYEDKEEFDFV